LALSVIYNTTLIQQINQPEPEYQDIDLSNLPILEELKK